MCVFLCLANVQTSRLVNEMTCTHTGLPAFGVTRALNEARALLQKLLHLNYSNLVTAAFNRNREAGSRGEQKATDREGMTVWGSQDRNINIEMFGWGLKSQKTAKTE